MLTQSNNVVYQAVVGVAGHVDHGKTALIEALTGIVTARPHEQALGMTQDLGFAYFNDDAGNTIGVVDVPGHERYLRNMVAGVWHLNTLILVVAADEGWMPMTTSHLEVAHAMGLKEIILCINKCDKVSSQQLAETEELALEMVMDMTGLIPELVSVSAMSGENIPVLRQTIIESVARTVMPAVAEMDEEAPAEHDPQLYVDRAFVVNGIGTVVTGTLAQGKIAVGDKVRCYPSGQVGMVRSIQAYHRQLDSVNSTCRVALNVKGLNRKDIGRGGLLVGMNRAVTLCEQCIVRLGSFDSSVIVRKQREVEVAVGTWHGVAKICYIPETQLARLVFKQAVPLQFGQRLAVIVKGGSRLLHGAEVVWQAFIPSFQKRAIYNGLAQLPATLKFDDEFRLLLNVRGYFDAEKMGVASGFDGVHLAPFMFEPEWLEKNEAAIHNLLAEFGAMGDGEISTRLRIENEAVAVIMQAMKRQDKVHLSHGKWYPGQGMSEDELPSEAQELLAQIRHYGKDGLELNKVTLSGGKKWLRQLAHQKLITALNETIYYDMALYTEMVKAVISEHKMQDRISMADIKDNTGLSRKYAIPLANRMEKDGWVRRDGDERIIVKPWS